MNYRNKNRHTILLHKIIFTIFIVLVYLLGRSLPLFGINLDVDTSVDIDVQTLLLQTISGDRYAHSVLTLGIFPYMIATLIVQVAMAIMSSERKARISSVTSNRVQLAIMLVIAIIQAMVKVDKLAFIYSGKELFFAQVVACVEMIAGAFVILWLSDRNSKYGIGGQTVLIYINILDSLTATIQEAEAMQVIIPIIISVIVVIVVVIMENAEFRIPVQRVAIHSIYADKNYMAIKLNPIGVMPVMFSSAVFMLLQMIVSVISIYFPNAGVIQWITANMNLNEIFGIIIYIGVLYFLTIMMAMVFISPKDLTEQFLKSGDSIVGIHAGDDTYHYLRRIILTTSIISSTVMGACILIPMLFQYYGVMDSSLAVLPSSFMMLTGMFNNLMQEVIAVRNFDEYRPFI